MRLNNTIIKQPFPPKTTIGLWDDGQSLNIFREGKWTPVVKTMSDDLTTRLIETLDNHAMSVVEFSQDAESNLEILKSLDLTTNYICNYKLSEDEIIHGTYYNGTISCFYNNEVTLWDINFGTGVISKTCHISCEFLGTEVVLDVCSSGSTEAAKNLEKLIAAYIQLGDHFTVNIDAGIGVGKFIPEQGGEGHITTAEGVSVHYIFNADGSVSKTFEVDIVNLSERVSALEIV